MKCTHYFKTVRTRRDRAMIQDEWILRTMEFPDYKVIQTDGRIRRWKRIDEMEGRYLRVIMLFLIGDLSYERP